MQHIYRNKKWIIWKIIFLKKTDVIYVFNWACQNLSIWHSGKLTWWTSWIKIWVETQETSACNYKIIRWKTLTKEIISEVKDINFFPYMKLATLWRTIVYYHSVCTAEKQKQEGQKNFSRMIIKSNYNLKKRVDTA